MDDAKIIAETLSRFGGQLDALQSAVLGVFEMGRHDELFRAALFRRVEQAYAIHLQQSTNPQYLEGFEATMALFQEVLQPGPSG